MSGLQPRVTLYGRPGCCLCDEALGVLESLRREVPFALESVDITTSDELHRRYLVRIPVVVLDGRELYDYEVDAADLRARLARTSPDSGQGLE